MLATPFDVTPESLNFRATKPEITGAGVESTVCDA